MKKIIIAFVFMVSAVTLKAEYYHGFIDTVLSFTPTDTQIWGRDAEYYPQNIFGPPVKVASKDAPAFSESDVLSLGRDGEIIVGFKDYFIIDGEGADFTVFENVMINMATKKSYAEPAKIAVSQDGITFYEIPYDTLTLEGCAGVHHTNGSADPFDAKRSGGDAFDLADAGLKWAKWIKITDISRVVTHDSKHPYYNPLGMVLGFDLDAVAGINLDDKPVGIKNKPENAIQFADNTIMLDKQIGENLEIYSACGVCLFKQNIMQNVLNISTYPNGVYFIRYGGECKKIVKID